MSRFYIRATGYSDSPKSCTEPLHKSPRMIFRRRLLTPFPRKVCSTTNFWMPLRERHVRVLTRFLRLLTLLSGLQARHLRELGAHKFGTRELRLRESGLRESGLRAPPKLCRLSLKLRTKLELAPEGGSVP
jgi:hypothetical protein